VHFKSDREEPKLANLLRIFQTAKGFDGTDRNSFLQIYWSNTHVEILNSLQVQYK